jgi:vitamin K-dependent gamma-carboxylase
VSTGSIHRLRALLFSPVDIASLVAFRIAFGGIMLWEVIRFFSHDRIARYWIEPAFHFTYPGFHWVQPWPGHGMYIHLAVLAVFALLITAGAFYRVSAVCFSLGFIYTFLLEQTVYLNHLYLVCLISFLMIFLPAHRAFSVDGLRYPKIRVDIIPFWPLFLLRMQVAIVYIYAGIAKLNLDWFRGEPVRMWLREKSETPGLGWLFERPETFYLIAWGGLAFDLFIVPFLIWKCTRAAAFLVAVCFHLLNVWFFDIGIFPWISIAMTTLFFEPDWPRRFVRRLSFRSETRPPEGAHPSVGSIETDFKRQRRIARWIIAYLTCQLFIPLRHWLYPGDVAWTEEGHQFSWRMKLRDKEGVALFFVTDPVKKETWCARTEAHLEPWQHRQMAKRPELIRQFAHYLATVNQQELGSPVEVRVQSLVSLNNHPPARLIRPEIDLSKEPYRIGPAKWISPRPAHSLTAAGKPEL